ncbi:hypothetical protein B0J11DRAFT_214912 [Dendryphion nanum]|uniref:Diphthamide biosynthesis protein 4 n=1 Tax=Dendryphion nanum TaxID=256645 RepID=A0A9P9IUZ9_9PLEO|nr:hypothetical protein B0J11DRAFT_214912 [Dendryphion nanum]
MLPIPTHYQVLALSPSNASTSPSALRSAYRAALLRAHPDKLSGKGVGVIHGNDLERKNTLGKGEGSTKFTIDQIKTAFSVLNNPASRAEYDEQIRRRGIVNGSVGKDTEAQARETQDFLLGLEVLDLGDFTEVEIVSQTTGSGEEVGGAGVGMEWIRKCRCGAERGFWIGEEELEEACARGEKEVLVGCEGCSLWVRVGFDVEG